MTFHEPISEAEGRQILAWHNQGLSTRQMRVAMQEDSYPGPVRGKDGIRIFLKRHGRTPHPSAHGPVEGPAEFCDSSRHPEPIKRVGAHNECPVCKRIRAGERRTEIRIGLMARMLVLEQMGGEAAEIAAWIEENVRVA